MDLGCPEQCHSRLATPLRQRECFEHLDCVDSVHYTLLWSSATLRTHLHLSVIYLMDDKRNNMASGLGALMHHMLHAFHFMLMHRRSSSKLDNKHKSKLFKLAATW